MGSSTDTSGDCKVPDTVGPVSGPVARRWRMPWPQLIACLVILVGTAVFLYPHMASWFSQKEQSRVLGMSHEWLEQPPNDEASHRAEQIAKAHRYNEALASGAQLKANERVPVGDGASSDESLVYENILSFADNGFMGRLRYDALEIDLPIYHGTSEDTLLRGVGHLEGTSIPVGGVGTRAVLTAHRGLPTATLFNELNRAVKGDIVTVAVLDQVLSYRVIESRVVEPDETEAILPDPDQDLLTLVTCTPLGVNSHRILVTAERITPTPSEEIAAAEAAPDLPGFPWWAVILGAVIVFVVVYVWWSGYPPKKVGGKKVAGRRAGGAKSGGEVGGVGATTGTK
ncbi:MAG: class C sortase [Ancrocorticia sp.]